MANVKVSDEFVEDDELLEDESSEVVSPPEEEFSDGEVEDMDPSEEIWPGGPTAGHIVAWKKQFGDVFVSTFTPDDHVVWRTMTRFEYRNHIKTMEQIAQSGQAGQAEAALLNEEAIAEICTLYPPFSRETMGGDMAGIASSLAGDILEASGFVALEVRKL
jgi:hypothetical protein